MRTNVEKITPQMAALILAEQNPGNRPLRPERVNVLANIMRNGQFRLTHQGIAFDTFKNLIDGQHRLAACVAAEVPIEVQVTRDADPESFSAIDVGANRSAADLLFIEAPEVFSGKEAKAVTIATAMTLATHKGNPRGVPPEWVMRRTLDYKDLILLVLPIIAECKWGQIRSPIIAAFCNAMRTDDSVSAGFKTAEKVLPLLRRFVSLQFTGDNDPMKQLYLRQTNSTQKVPGSEAYGIAVTAILSALSGQERSFLRKSSKDFGEK